MHTFDRNFITIPPTVLERSCTRQQRCPKRFACSGTHCNDVRASADFTVADAFPHLESALGKCEIEDSFDLSITCENTQIPQRSLAFYLQRLTRESNLNGMSLCFVGKNDYLIALDSHPHHLQGAMIAQTKMGNREELLTALKLLLSPKFNTCRGLTFVSFS